MRSVSYVTVILIPIKLQPIFGWGTPPVLLSYLGIYAYLILGFLIAALLVLISSLFSSRKLNLNKLSPYECGFERFNNSKLTLNMDFFSIGILFLMFDLELALIFPWVMNFKNATDFSFFLILGFIWIIILAYILELYRSSFLEQNT